MEWVSHGARYYNSEWGRFISPDPLREFHNQYSYCWDNPINVIDRDGRGGSGIDAKVPVLTSWGYDDPIAAWELDINLALQDELERQAYLAEVEAKEEINNNTEEKDDDDCVTRKEFEAYKAEQEQNDQWDAAGWIFAGGTAGSAGYIVGALASGAVVSGGAVIIAFGAGVCAVGIGYGAVMFVQALVTGEYTKYGPFYNVPFQHNSNSYPKQY